MKPALNFGLLHVSKGSLSLKPSSCVCVCVCVYVQACTIEMLVEY